MNPEPDKDPEGTSKGGIENAVLSYTVSGIEDQKTVRTFLERKIKILENVQEIDNRDVLHLLYTFEEKDPSKDQKTSRNEELTVTSSSTIVKVDVFNKGKDIIDCFEVRPDQIQKEKTSFVSKGEKGIIENI